MTPEHNSRVWRVGIPLGQLRDHAPSGAARAAWAIAERLIADTRFELLAISEPGFDRNDVVFECWELSQWLERNPLATAPACTEAKDLSPPAASTLVVSSPATVVRLKRVLLRLGLLPAARSARRVGGQCVGSFRSFVRRLALERPARAVWHFLRRQQAKNTLRRGHSDSVAVARRAGTPEPDYISLHDLDMVLSFDCHDTLWDWPTELFSCTLVGMFSDAVGFRVHEEGGWSHYCQTGKLVNRSAWVWCNSRSSEEDLHTFFPNSRSKTRLIHLGHDRERFLPRGLRGRRRAARRRSRGIRLAVNVELERRKNHAGVLRACQRLARRSPDQPIILVLIGESANHEASSILEQQAICNLKVEFKGHVPDSQMGDLLRSCDVFVFASLWEGFGAPVLEAMSAGVPVVCSQNSSLPELAAENAFYCDPYDPVSIAEAIHEALSLTPAGRRRWIEKARDWAGNFTWSRTAAELSKLLLDGAKAVQTSETPSYRFAGAWKRSPDAAQ